MRCLGRGGMGAVYEGIHVESDEPAAVKMLSAALADDADFRQRFEVEIETLRKLYHPNIVQLFGFGEQDGHLFYAMELVDGSSLEEELRRGRRFSWREVAQIGIDVCRALRHAHDRGIVHRDIKPANLLLAKDGRVKLSDFGIARLFGNTRITAAGSVLGTAEYMAPEQADARGVGPRSDLYSLGGVLYCLLASVPPFRAKSLPEMLEKHRSALPEPVIQHSPETPDELNRIVMQLLEKEPEKRIASATLVARRLSAMIHALSVQPDTAERMAIEQMAQEATPEELSPRVPDGRTATLVSGQSRPDDLSRTRTQTVPAAKQPAGVPEPKELPGTQATAAFQAFDVQRPAEGTSSNSPTEKPQRPSSGRFVAVSEEELDADEPEPQNHALISLHTWFLAASLVTLGLTAWYFLRPPSADALYEEIREITQDRSIDSLKQAERPMKDFLERYSSDSRAVKLREYMNEIELDRLERQFERRAGGLAKAEDLLPIERAYLEAINYASVDPERGLARFKGIVDLYQDRTDLSGPAGKCLELARRRYEELSRRIERVSADSSAEVAARLAAAERLYGDDPEAARSMWQAVIDLYGDKPWAASLIVAAQEALKTHPAAKPSDEPPASEP